MAKNLADCNPYFTANLGKQNPCGKACKWLLSYLDLAALLALKNVVFYVMGKALSWKLSCMLLFK